MTTATDAKLSLSQTEIWLDKGGLEHRVDDMSIRYKLNVLRFLERRASRIVARALADAWIRDAIERGSAIVPCVIGEKDGVPVECGATHVWSHGVWHGVDPMPGSEADNLVDLELPGFDGFTHDEAVALIRETPLMKRLANDIANGLGGDDD